MPFSHRYPNFPCAKFRLLGKFTDTQEKFHGYNVIMVRLLVYGTLRPGFDGPMARWLHAAALPLGPATVSGALYHVADYPGFVPGPMGMVHGDLFALPDPDAMLARLDEYEECAGHYPEPHEYRRELMRVDGADGPVDAWVYIYMRPVAGLAMIEGGDFLGLRASGR